MNETDGVPKPSDIELEAADRRRREKANILARIQRLQDQRDYAAPELAQRLTKRIERLLAGIR